MSRMLWIVIFAVSVFVSEVSSASSKTTSTSATTSSQPANTSDSAAATTESASTVRYERNETTPHVGNSSELSKHVSSNNETVTSSENKRNEKDCHMTDESKDMLNCNVFDMPLESATNSSQENETNKTKQGITKFNDTYPPKIFPHDKNVKSIDKADEATRRRLDPYVYSIVPTEVETVTIPTVIIKLERTNKSDANTVRPLATVKSFNASNDRNTSLQSDPEIVAQKSSNVEGISQKTIALTMIITLVIAVAAIYAGMIAWKRYLEYKYSHRQLLNNDLEFDESDFHQYEL